MLDINNPKSLLENLTTKFLLFLGAAGLFFTGLDIFVDISNLPEEHLLSRLLSALQPHDHILLLLVSFLCLALGLERVTYVKRIEDGLDVLAKRIDNSGLVEIKIDSYNDFWESATTIVKDAEKEINVLIFFVPNEEKKENAEKLKNYRKSIAEKLRNSNLNIQYNILIAYDPHLHGQPQPSLQDTLNSFTKMKTFYKNAGVIEKIEFKLLKARFPITMIIVDTKHLLIAFPTIGGDGRLHGIKMMIKTSNNEKQLSAMLLWYVRSLWESPLSVSDVAKELKLALLKLGSKPTQITY